MDKNHPSYDIIGTKGNALKGKKIALCVTGSVAAIKAPDIARALMRHGATVFPVMSQAAQSIITPDIMHWATGNKPVTELTGAIEHIELAGSVQTRVDLILVAPVTANTISKIACAIDDTTVTSLVTTGWGQGLPLILVPAMHESMYNHPLLRQNIDKLQQHGVEVLLPRIEEGKAKIAETNQIIMVIKNMLNLPLRFKHKKILISAGRTVEYIDPVRVITNNSTGKMGMALAKQALRMGAEVTLILGKSSVTASEQAKVISVDTSAAMGKAVFSELKNRKYDLFFACGAVSDWKPKKQSAKKISTHEQNKLIIELEPTQKIIDQVKEISPQTVLIAFRALYNLSQEELIEQGYQRLKKAKADFIAVNDVGKKGVGFECDTNEIILIDSKKQVQMIKRSLKEKVATDILEMIAKKIKK